MIDDVDMIISSPSLSFSLIYLYGLEIGAEKTTREMIDQYVSNIKMFILINFIPSVNLNLSWTLSLDLIILLYDIKNII